MSIIDNNAGGAGADEDCDTSTSSADMFKHVIGGTHSSEDHILHCHNDEELDLCEKNILDYPSTCNIHLCCWFLVRKSRTCSTYCKNIVIRSVYKYLAP